MSRCGTVIECALECQRYELERLNVDSTVEIETGVQARCAPGAAKTALRDLKGLALDPVRYF